MPTYSIIKLCNITPMHLGSGRATYEKAATDLHSDTLSAALAAIYAQTASTFDAKWFMESFLISSAFPFYGNRYFLPKPIGRLSVDLTDCKEESVRKKLKKLKYIELPLWEQIARGEDVKISKEQIMGDFLVAAGSDCDIELFARYPTLRVTVSRTGDNEDPYYIERTFFSPQAGLYCIIDCNEQTKGLIENLFVQLGEAGIGSYKSTGCGQFTIETATIEIPSANDANGALLLSQYIPTKEELGNIDLDASRYELVLRNGYMAGSSVPQLTHLQKKSVYMFKCGSLLATSSHLEGKLADVTPVWNDNAMHPVLRSGRSFILPIKMQEL